MNYDDPSVTYSTMATDSAMGAWGAFFLIYSLVVLALSVVMIVAMWKVYKKAGQPGWASLVPFYNVYVLNKMTGRPEWFFWAALASMLLMFVWIPVFYVFWLIWCLDLAKSFGRSATFGVVGLFLFGFVGWPMLGFGKDKYAGPSAGGGATPAAPVTPAAPPAA